MSDSDILTASYTRGGPTISNVMVGGISPVITGTDSNKIFTFAVNPTVKYATGTATLSTDVSYQIKAGTINVTGDATKSDDLVNIALDLLKAQGGTTGGVMGATLISRSPLTITLTANAISTGYKVQFVAAP
jgi:hypothetical protein